jgi:hypothetical protein
LGVSKIIRNFAGHFEIIMFNNKYNQQALLT